MSDDLPVVAAFDFDGTLTYRDSLLPFMIFVRGKMRSTFYISLEIPRLLGFVLKMVSRQEAKEALLSRFFGGENIESLRRWGLEFSELSLPYLLKPEALQRFHWHKKQGHRCIIVSAGIDLYMQPWAKKVGFSDVISSQLAVASNNLVSGKLQGVNCWGPEKVQRINRLLGPKSGYVLYAYGDSRGDQEMLELADYAYKETFI